jgi:hypothetical protein
MIPRRFVSVAAGLLLAGVAGGWLPCRAAELIPLQQGGPTASRVNLVLLAEGYRDVERDKFVSDATKVLDGILGAEPLRAYARYFNGFGIFVASAESGADHPAQSVYRDTYFNSTFNSYHTERLLTIPPNDMDTDFNHGERKVYDLLAALLPEFDLAAVLVNDSEYGGSGGSVLVVSTHEKSALVATHELGHTYAHLGDEYPDPYAYPDTEEPNTTRETDRSLIKWRAWIDPDTPIPTPPVIPDYEHVVGLFEGAHYHATGWYRPQYSCIMRQLSSPYCAVCSEALVLNTHRLVSTVEDASPPTSAPVEVGGPQSFHVSLLAPSPDTLTVSWRLNDVPLAPPVRDTVQLDPAQLPLETNVLVASVTDSTPLVRTDATGALVSDVKWTVIRVGSGAPWLAAVAGDGGVDLSWPVEAADAELQAADRLVDPGWKPVDATPQKGDDGRVHVRIPADPGMRFFRLFFP